MKESEMNPLKLPFLGSLENGEPFEYLLTSISTDLAEIAILQWFLNRIQLQIGNKIDLHLPYHLTTLSSLKGNISGTVIAAKHSEEDKGEFYQISLDKLKTNIATKYNSLNQYTSQLQETASLPDLCIHLIKDSMILKAGIRVYFKHLIPYFSRICDYSHQEYADLEKYFLHDLEKRITDNEKKLENLYQVSKEKITKPEEIAVYIDLEPLREILESEISLSVFNIIFSKKKTPTLSDTFDLQSGILMYINAIKNLEKRLYSNYNHIVILYLKSIN